MKQKINLRKLLKGMRKRSVYPGLRCDEGRMIPITEFVPEKNVTILEKQQESDNTRRFYFEMSLSNASIENPDFELNKFIKAKIALAMVTFMQRKGLDHLYLLPDYYVMLYPHDEVNGVTKFRFIFVRKLNV